MRLFTGLLSPAFLALALASPAFGEAPARKDAVGDPLPDGAPMRLGTTRFRVSPLNPLVRLSPNGKLIAVYAGHDVIRLLDAADGSEVRRIQTKFMTTRLAFAPVGDMLATADIDGSIYLWDTATAKLLVCIHIDHFSIEEFNFSADGKILVVAWSGLPPKCVLRAYEIPGGKEIRSYESVHDVRMGVAVAPDGKTFAARGAIEDRQPKSPPDQLQLNQTVQVWDTATGKEAKRIETDRGLVTAIAFAPDGKSLALVTRSGALQFWDPAKGTLMRTLQGDDAGDGAILTFAPDGKRLFISGQHGRIEGWEVAPGKQLSLPKGPSGDPCSVVFPAGGGVLACSHDCQAVVVRDVLTGKAFGTAVGHKTSVGAVAFAADGKTLWSAGADETLIQWDVAHGVELKRLEKVVAANGYQPNWNTSGFAMRFSPGGKYLLSADDLGSYTVHLRETAANREVMTFTPRRRPDPTTGFPAAFSADGSVLVAAEGDLWAANSPTNVRLWKTDSGREFFALKAYKGQPSAAALSPDGKTLALATNLVFPVLPADAPEVLTWNISDGKSPHSFKRYEGPNQDAPLFLCYSPDGRVLAAVEAGGGVSVRDAATGADRWLAPSANEWVQAPAVFSPDGRLLAVASLAPWSEKANIRLWEVASGKVRREFSGRFAPVLSLAFSPDGATLASGSQDTTTLLWDVIGTQTFGADLKKELKAADLDALWADLAGDDAAAAGRAVARLAAAAPDAVPYLKKQAPRAGGEAPDEAAIAKLVDDLDADDFDAREKAERDLAEIGPAAGSALEGDPPLERKRRAGELLAKLAKPDLSPNALRLRRAVEALERAGTPEAGELLKALAKGRPGADLTEDARAALKRLEKRSAAAP